MKRCPYCLNPLDDLTSKKPLLELLRKRSKPLQKTIRQVFIKIDSHIPSDKNKWRATNFLNAVRNISDEQLEFTIDQYMYNEYYAQVKGYNYLTGMAINMFINKDAQKEAEIKRIGDTPRIINKEEYE